MEGAQITLSFTGTEDELDEFKELVDDHDAVVWKDARTFP